MTITNVLPTLLDVVGASAAVPDDLDGYSQIGALQGALGKRADYAVSLFPPRPDMHRWHWKITKGLEMQSDVGTYDGPLPTETFTKVLLSCRII